ncbi:TonB-dependent receptor domain-containing protein [Sphingosinicella rhizophila]|uniref:TonB-dependent receptor n=1 Tax=Sphingosinicella rhizophila TaxID=3050082 RepID=A0ABU3Q9P3_9SPHN|nr:TonB-dependent receptor [Sphingosinicella sp. GR2756]MDT9600017.1 TonB-dependent receptor [Sphingosinicella sp. GR2756]
MNKFGLLSGSALLSLTLSLSMAAPASAQESSAQEDPTATLQTETEIATGQDATAAAADESETIVVTGSRIRRPNLESSVPITSITGEDFIQTGDLNVGDTLNDLPQLRSTFAQNNPGLGVGIAGLNLLDLRGLGTARTLVLVNGRRHVAADILNNAVSPDINSIPSDLIERVDIVTGAQSSIYGSDAIAGVVNFILRRDYDGFQLRGNFGISDEGFGGNQYVSGMFGKNFAGGRGNVTVHGEYSRQDRVFGSQLPWLRSVDGFVVTDLDPAGLDNGSDGNPDRTFFRDIRSATINRYGLVAISQNAGVGPSCGTGISNGVTPGTPYSCTYLFNPDGRLAPVTGDRVGSGPNGTFIGGNGQNGREDELLSIQPFLERYTFNALAHYEFSDAAEVFLEAKWGRVNARGSNASPSFTQGQGTQFDTRERFRLDNPFLNPADSAFLADAILASGCNPSIATACGTNQLLTDAQRDAIADGSYRVVMGKQFLDVGIRDEEFKRDTYRIVAGLRGTFNDDWNYEVSANYGKFTEDTVTYGYLDRQKFLLSLDAGLNPTTGQIQCRAQFDPAAAFAYQSAALSPEQNAAYQARLASDIASCVPYNPFGAPDNSAAANYFTYNARNKASLSQFVVSGFVSGDMSQLFELPGGPIRFAVGGEYRQEKADYINDPYIELAATNAVVVGRFDPPTFKVKEAFGEIQIPILKDTPFFEELTVTAAGRISDYNSAVGTVYAYNAGIDWAPVRDLRFRANYGRSVRAPNVAETGFPIVPNFAPSFSDPCRGNAIGTGSATRAANCAADLGALLPNLEALGTPSLPILSGSNPNLKEETSDSWTIGAVFQPRFIPGLSISADYFDITVNDVIVSLSAQDIADNCYDAPTLDNPFCGLFERFRGPGTGPFGENPGEILGNSLISAGVNFAKRVRRGIDVDAAYRTDLGSNLKLATNLIYVHNFQNSNFEDPARPDYEDVLLGELGDPKDEFRWDTDLTWGDFTFGYQLRYIGPMYLNTFEDFNSLGADRPPENADYASIRKFPAVFYHAIRFEWNIPNPAGIGESLRFYGGVDNLFDRHPPYGLSGTGTSGAGQDRATGNAAIYDVRGRTFYAGFRARF